MITLAAKPSKNDAPDRRQIILSREQRAAVEHGKGPACVIAGAGTGKTTALVSRAAYLVRRRRVRPERVCITTFTRRATAEVAFRLRAELGEPADRVRVSTVDSLILDTAETLVRQGLLPSTRLVSETEQRILMLEAAWHKYSDGRGASKSQRAWWVSGYGEFYLRVMESSVRAVRNHRSAGNRGRVPPIQVFKNIQAETIYNPEEWAESYFDHLEALGVQDYEGTHFSLLQVLRTNPGARKFVRELFDHILVDEFQDTSRLQADIILELCGKRRNIWAVGDPCQQIYSWRGAAVGNMEWLKKATKAKTYFLTENRRSNQPILDAAHRFLRKRHADLSRSGMLKRLRAARPGAPENQVLHGSLEDALRFVEEILAANPKLRPCDIAILSRSLTKAKIAEITRHKGTLELQFMASRADHVMEDTLGAPPNWKPGIALRSLYASAPIAKTTASALDTHEFSKMRTLRPLAEAANALDATVQRGGFDFSEAWPALKLAQDRDISVNPAIAMRESSVQVMSIHAAKGLEFPVVLLMKLGDRFPKRDKEEARLAYVGATRARDILILVHTKTPPTALLNEFSATLENVKWTDVRDARPHRPKEGGVVLPASNLDLHEECSLRFFAHHEGRYLPPWNPSYSQGARLHRAVELYLRAGLPDDTTVIQQCFQRGFEETEGPARELKPEVKGRLAHHFDSIAHHLRIDTREVIDVERPFRLVTPKGDIVEGVADAIVRDTTGEIVLKEWKTSATLSKRRTKRYGLQAATAALALQGLGIQRVEVVPLLAPARTVSVIWNARERASSERRLARVFVSVRKRAPDPTVGDHCTDCPLRVSCPAHADQKSPS